MNAAQRRHYDAIHQLAREEWPAEPVTIHPTPTASMTREQFREMVASLPDDDPDALHAAITATAAARESGR